VVFLGAALAIESHRHIKLDIIAVLLPPATLRWLRSPLYLLSSVLCAMLGWAAMRFWYDDWHYIADHERWSSILALIIPAGFLLLALHFLIGGLFRPAADDASA
jgi:TRAP-type C4-dicarboxylate transport system permease small subunit